MINDIRKGKNIPVIFITPVNRYSYLNYSSQRSMRSVWKVSSHLMILINNFNRVIMSLFPFQRISLGMSHEISVSIPILKAAC